MCRQPLPSTLSPPSAKLMIMALEEYGNQSRRGIRGSGGGGVKEKSLNASNIEVVMDDVVPSITVESRNASKEESTSARNAPGKSSYANVTGKPSGKKVNFRTLFTPGVPSTTPIVEKIDKIEKLIIERKVTLVDDEGKQLENVASSCQYDSEDEGYDPYNDDMYEGQDIPDKLQGWMFKLRADEELNNTIVVAMTKLVGEGFYLCTIRVEYEWKPPRCSSCKVFGHVLVECPKKIFSDVVKNLKNPGQAARELITRKTNIDGKLTLVDDDGKPIPKVVYTVNEDSDSEVEDVVDDHAVFMASTSLKSGIHSGYDINILFEQWRTTKWDDDYDFYDDDLYESHDMSENLQAICDYFDITVCGPKKK
ncbi:hypothetical protein Tco_1320134 [Tanacetum coccineum]